MTQHVSPYEKLIPLRPKDHYILYSLLDEDRYGYSMAQEIQRLSEGKVRVEAGNLHRHIQKLVRQGLVVPTDSRPASEFDDERRRYYAITEEGRKVWAADIHHMESLVRAARKRRSLHNAKSV